jgi:hypothetical protein
MHLMLPISRSQARANIAPKQRVFGRTLADHHLEALELIARQWKGDRVDRAFPHHSRQQLLVFAAEVEGHTARNLRCYVSDTIHKLNDSKDNLLLSLVELVLHFQDYYEHHEEEGEEASSQNKSLDEKVARLDEVIALATRMRVNLRPFDKYCDVCLDEHRADQFPESPITSTCSHEPSICLAAIAAHLDTKLEG